MNEHFSIIWGTRQIRNPQLSLYIAASVKLLKGMGIKAGERIAICSDNSVEYIILLLALWQIKAVASPISSRWPDKTIHSYTSKINARQLMRSADIMRTICFDARQQNESQKLQELDLEQEVTIIATSGSSGEAKAAVHTWGNHYYSAKGSNEMIPLSSSDRWLLSLPLYHVSGIAILVRCLLSGAAIVIGSESDVIPTIQRSQTTHVSFVSTQLQRLMAEEKNHEPLKRLKCILLGGSAIPKTLIDKSIKLGLNIYLSYGLTEMSSQVATGKVNASGSCCVKVLPYRQLSISPQGEIMVKGEVLFKGYVAGTKIHLPLQNVSPPNVLVGGPIKNNFWFSTGDIGQMDQDGCVTVTGRRDSMFISGGENIHPEEIERVLLSIKGISEAIVVAKEDKEFGFRPIAFIKYVNEILTEEYLIECLQAELPRFKVPIAFFPWPQNLITQGIKISRQDFLKILPRR